MNFIENQIKQMLVNVLLISNERLDFVYLRNVYAQSTEHKTITNDDDVRKFLELFLFTSILTFTSHSGEIFQSFSTDIAKFTFKPGCIRPDMAHGILENEMTLLSKMYSKRNICPYFDNHRCNA